MATIADEVVSVRALDATELRTVNELAGSELWGGLGHLLLLAGLALACLGLYAALAQDFWLLPGLLLAGRLARVSGEQRERIRRGRALRADHRLGRLLLFHSPRGHRERLAASGLLWRRDGADASWRVEAS